MRYESALLKPDIQTEDVQRNWAAMMVCFRTLLDMTSVSQVNR